jgi:Mg2+-importing ATPase
VFLTIPPEFVPSKMETSIEGLSSQDVEKRLETYGPNVIVRKKKRTAVAEFVSLFRNPLVIILLLAGLISGFLGERVNAAIIFVMVLLSVCLNFYQERKANKAAEKLTERITTTATVLRDGVKKECKLSEIVPGDLIFLSAGDMVPADSRLIIAKDFHINESALTGESFPVEKSTAAIEKPTDEITGWKNYVFLGTSVVSGTATAVVTKTGTSTEYGSIAQKLLPRAPVAESTKGLRQFGVLIMEVTFALVMFVFIILALLKKDILESLLFAVALAVGLTPELLPMILTVNLSKGAVAMSKKDVIVKRLASIQDFGSMDVLCADKTGTLTENKIKLIRHPNLEGNEDEKVLLFSYINSHFQTGLRSPLDNAILEHEEIDLKNYKKIDEIPFDFARRRISVVIEHEGQRYLVTKGAPEEIFKICARAEVNDKTQTATSELRMQMEALYYDLSFQGFRVLGVAYKPLPVDKSEYTIQDETDLDFIGFGAFLDPPRESAKEALELLGRAGVELKILTGDNQLVTAMVIHSLGFRPKGTATGGEIALMSDEELAEAVEKKNVFTRLTPDQKNRIISVLKKNGHVVGFLGDGINDAPSLKTSDVGISVDTAVDVAKESADLILLKKDLRVLAESVLEGRKTLGNTMKYIMMGISSNFGNMFSAAGAAVFLPFLPMLPVQILLNNLLYDMSELGIPTDNVDEEYVQKPQRWDISFIRKFMITFGPISSVFDFLTFFTMISYLILYHSYSINDPIFERLFQTAWFVESLSTQALIIFVIRTRRIPFYKSKPSKILLAATFGVIAFAWLVPYSPLGQLFLFEPIPLTFLLILLGMIALYVVMVEKIKKGFYDSMTAKTPPRIKTKPMTRAAKV